MSRTRRADTSQDRRERSEGSGRVTQKRDKIPRSVGGARRPNEMGSEHSERDLHVVEQSIESINLG
jgi:hypothetical protein